MRRGGVVAAMKRRARRRREGVINGEEISRARGRNPKKIIAHVGAVFYPHELLLRAALKRVTRCLLNRKSYRGKCHSLSYWRQIQRRGGRAAVAYASGAK